MNPSGRKIIQALEQLEVPPPIDSARFKDELGSGAQDRFKKGMIIHAAISAANGDEEALDFLNRQIGLEKGEDGKFPEGSIKRYQNDTVQFLVDDEEAKEGLLNALAEKLPLKSMIEGEEAMAIGGLSADPATLKRLFGVDNYEDLPTEKGEVIQHRDGTVGVYVKDPFGNYLEYIWYSPEARKVFIND